MNQGEILVVDDVPDNLRLLSKLLRENGYRVRVAINGKMALTAATLSPPDLILLDINMPHTNGYEVCQQLKANSQTHDIPVIFISAWNEVLDKLKAFEVGGVDYITRPFQLAEVLARIATQLTLRRLQQQLQAQNIQLKQEIKERQQAEEKYRNILENAVEGFFQSTPNGRYLMANPALARLYGYDSVEELLIGITSIDQQIYVRSGRRDELNVYLKQYGQVSNFESQIYRRDGSKIWISESVRSVRDDNGTLLYYEGTVQDVTERRRTEAELFHQRRETERLLLNILPQPIAERLKRSSETIADHFSAVTVLFADIVDFTQLATQISPTQLVTQLNQIFSEFDRLVELYDLEKIKTIGDEYMAVGGLPRYRPDHIEAISELALAMQRSIAQFYTKPDHPFQLRIGIHTGPVIAGIIGRKKITYDLWGETVNLASRMQTQGAPGRIQVTSAVYHPLQGKFYFEERGTIDVKGVGVIETYWLVGSQL